MTELDVDPECGVHYSLKDGTVLCRLMSKLQSDVTMAAPSESTLAYKQVLIYVQTWLACCNSIVCCCC